MLTIHKFILHTTDEQIIEVNKGAHLLCVQMQRRTPCLWVKVNTEHPTEKIKIFIVGTGKEIPAFADNYLGTFQMYDGDLILHVYYTYAVDAIG